MHTSIPQRGVRKGGPEKHYEVKMTQTWLESDFQVI